MKPWLTLLLTMIVFFAGQAVFAQGVRVGPDGEFSPQTLKLPYAFYNENFGFAGGFVYGKVGSLQKQATILTTVMVGTKGGMGFLVGKDIQMPRIERLFFDPIVSVGYFSDSKSFVDGNPDFANERAGSNDSDEDNYVEGDGWDNFFRLKFKYLLPIGNGRDEIITTIKMKDGLPISEPKGGTSLNPFKSGRSYLEMRPFYRSQEIDGDDVDETVKTNGVDLSDSASGARCRGILAGLTARIHGPTWRVSWTSTFRLKWGAGCARGCWPSITGPPIRQPGTKNQTGRSPTGRRLTPAQPWAVCGACAAFPHSVSTTGPPPITRRNCA
jgi:hypothetical protein